MTAVEIKTARQNTATKGSGKRALITGASSGIGEVFARKLAARDYDLTLVARRRERLEHLAEELTAAHGGSCEVIEADLAQAEAVAAIEKRIGRGDVTMLVNCAGFGTRGDFAGLPVDRELEEIDVNVRALTRISHAALKAMMRSTAGTIINVASTGAFQPVPYMATYAATKAYVLWFSEALHEEAKPYGVTVTCLCPGPVRTEFQQVAGLDDSRMRFGWTSPEQVVLAALRAAARGQAVVIPGAMNRAGAVSAKLAPRFLSRKIAGAMFKRAGIQQSKE